jgi:Protein of unknown function (DUF2924)
MTTQTITERVAGLSTIGRSALVNLWQEVFKTDPPPKLRKGLLIRILAYRLQEQAFGGLSLETRTRLRQLAKRFELSPQSRVSKSPTIKPGTRLLREWRGQTHLVNVEQDGYEYRDNRYQSLSEIARLITGTQWSGPLFFGLKQKQPPSRAGL